MGWSSKLWVNHWAFGLGRMSSLLTGVITYVRSKCQVVRAPHRDSCLPQAPARNLGKLTPTAWRNQQVGNPPTKIKQIDANPPWIRLRVIKLLSYFVGIFKNNYSIMVLIATIMFQASKVWKPLMSKIRASIKRTLNWSIQLGHCKDFLNPPSLNNCKQAFANLAN